MNAKSLKILHVLSQRPDSTGSGIYVQAMIREAEAAGHDNFLVAGSGAGCFQEPLCIARENTLFVTFHQGDVGYHIPGMSDVMPYTSSRFCDLSKADLKEYEVVFSKTLQKAVGRFQPHIIHSHHLWLVSTLARGLFPDIPMVTSCHGSDLRQFQNCPHLQDKVAAGCRDIDVVLALSHIQKRDISRLYDIPCEKIRLTGAGYNNELFYLESKPTPDPVQLVYAGKLSNAKGVPWFLRALQAIESPAWQLHLIGGGSGEEKAQCLTLAKLLGERVHVHGAIPQTVLAKIIRQAHILVLPSFYEGLPLVILEGLAGGCRLVVTDLPGTRELLGDTDCDFISKVKTPRLHHIDQPDHKDEDQFEQDLKAALQRQILAASKSAVIDLSPLEDLLGAYTWQGVFKKVERAYQLSLNE